MATSELNGTVHVYERAGLGLAPFRYLGCEERRGPIKSICPVSGVEVSVGAPGQPMGSCDLCGNGIAFCFMVRSSDGRTFKVGSECINKSGDAGLVNRMKSDQRAATAVRAQGRIGNARAMLSDPAVRAALAEMPAPSPSRSPSALEWAEWMMRNAGTSGMTKVARVIERAAGE